MSNWKKTFSMKLEVSHRNGMLYFFEKMIAGSEPIFNSIFGAQKLEEERKRENNPNLRAAANVSDNVDANIVTFQLEEDPPTG